MAFILRSSVNAARHVTFLDPVSAGNAPAAGSAGVVVDLAARSGQIDHNSTTHGTCDGGEVATGVGRDEDVALRRAKPQVGGLLHVP
jgi:hypothetical protein